MEGTAFPEPTVDFKSAAHALKTTLGDEQAQAASRPVADIGGAEKSFEQPRLFRRIDPDAPVFDG